VKGSLLRVFVSSWFVVISIAACSSPARRSARPVTLPDLSRVDPGVQAQVKERYDTLMQALKGSSGSSTDAELATAYGQYGMVLQAAEFFDAAEPCYLNAQALAPDEFRWPYYLASLHRSRGETDQAEAAYKRALQLRPDDLAALIWLGRLHLDQGRPEDAELLFARAFGMAPRDVAVLAGLGRVAVARRDYPQAVKYLEDALAIDPEAESLHAPLAAAYRGIGQLEKAQPHLRQWRNRDLPVPDPLQQEMDLLLESGLSYELRGIREFEVRDWKGAAEYFRKGLALTHANSPLRRSLQHKLGTALYLGGDTAGAQTAFEAVAEAGPPNGIDEATAKAHYSLAVLLASQGRAAPDVLRHFEAAVKYQPSYVEAHLAFADYLRRRGRPDAALKEYRETLDLNPRQFVARLGYAMCLVQARRYRDARDWLDEASRLFPDRTEFKMGLARVLATSPDDRVRDGRRAVSITQELYKGERTTALGETIAMALAEAGDYAQAIAIQREVIAAAQRAGFTGQIPHMTANLTLYERHEPSRTPWTDDDLALVQTSNATADTSAPPQPSR
jgi:tetratricopeptide (TPR) repeat protein